MVVPNIQSDHGRDHTAKRRSTSNKIEFTHDWTPEKSSSIHSTEHFPVWLIPLFRSYSTTMGKHKVDATSTASTIATLTTPFPTVPESHRDQLRQHLSQQIQTYLGEEEASLVDFCFQLVTTPGHSPATVFSQLQDVLDEDAPAFLDFMWNKIQELQQ